MEFNLKKLPNRFLIPLIIAVSFIGGFFTRNYLISGGFDIVRPAPTVFENINDGEPVGLDFSLFWDVWNIISEKHIDRDGLNLVKLRDGAISGMISAIGDPFTNYLPPKQSQRFMEDIGGKFGGVGIEIGTRDGTLTVIAPLADTPGARAGILAGDKITAVDGTSTVDISLGEAVELIRGPIGTEVVLTINRENAETKDFPIIRAEIKIPAVKWRFIDDDIAYIQLITFNRNMNSQFEKAAKEILEKDIDRIIIDLRNNPGGLLESAINISSWFLDSDEIVVIQDSGDGNKQEFTAFKNGRLKDKKVVILINQGSASASEIVAGALRDNNQTLLIGQTTFGKGSVQDVDQLKNDGSVKYTIARWLTPLEHSIDKTGLDPDIEVEITPENIEADEDPQLDKAIEIIKGL